MRDPISPGDFAETDQLVPTSQPPHFQLCQTFVCENAQKLGELFEHAVAAAEISLEGLFDSHYRPIEGSNPPQFLTRFCNLTDRIATPILEQALDLHMKVEYCCLVDRNGYLPTHNRRFSLPQRDDVTWNAAYSRNRRIFRDATGLAAAANLEPFLLQSYKRELGGCVFAKIFDISAPIFVGGRHWGALRLGFRG